MQDTVNLPPQMNAVLDGNHAMKDDDLQFSSITVQK